MLVVARINVYNLQLYSAGDTWKGSIIVSTVCMMSLWLGENEMKGTRLPYLHRSWGLPEREHFVPLHM